MTCATVGAHAHIRVSDSRTGGEKYNVWTLWSTGGGGGGIGKAPSIEVRGDECLARAGEQRRSIQVCFDAVCVDTLFARRLMRTWLMHIV